MIDEPTPFVDESPDACYFSAMTEEYGPCEGELELSPDPHEIINDGDHVLWCGRHFRHRLLLRLHG